MAIIVFPILSKKIKWLDITNPTEEELLQVSKDFNLHHYTLKDCLEPDHLPKFEDLGDTQFIISRIVVNTVFKKTDTIQSLSSKVAIFYNDEFIITVHRLPQAFLEEIKVKYVDSGRCKTTHEVVTKIMWQVLYSYDEPALILSNEVDAYEAKVFLKNLTPTIPKELYYLKRRAAIYNKLLMLSLDVINNIQTKHNDPVALQDLKDLHTRLTTLYTQIHDDITNLLNIYLSLSTQKTNEVMKILTIFSVFFMPLTFIVGIYGMNFEFMPELNLKWGYPAVLVAMVLVTAFIFWWFKRKKWF